MVSTDARSGITNDPNRADDPQYILRLIGQVITVPIPIPASTVAGRLEVQRRAGNAGCDLFPDTC
jgi:hypothetical protein